MKNILETIVTHKKIEVKKAKEIQPISVLEGSVSFHRVPFSLKENILANNSYNIIAEFKRRSPSKGWINEQADVATVTANYTRYGAACLSVLTDQQFFGGCNEDLKKARKNNIPILRKDFIIDEYQLIEAKAIGADVILLIAACLSPKQVAYLADIAKKLSLEVLLELHSESELDHICDAIDFVGVNNRNLKTFEVDIAHSIRILERLPEDKICIAESGINNTEIVKQLHQAGFKGFLIGENFMKNENPGLAFERYMQSLHQS